MSRLYILALGISDRNGGDGGTHHTPTMPPDIISGAGGIAAPQQPAIRASAKNKVLSGGAVEFCRELSGGRTSKPEDSEQMHPD
jgi:hypothetical protein